MPCPKQESAFKSEEGSFAERIRKILQEAATVDVGRVMGEYRKKLDEIISIKNEYKRRLETLYEVGKEFAANGEMDNASMFAELCLNVERITRFLSIYEAKTGHLIATLKGYVELGHMLQPIADYTKFTKCYECLKAKKVLEAIDRAIQSKHVCCEILEMLNQLSEYAPCGYKPITTLEVEKLKNEWLKTADEVKR